MGLLRTFPKGGIHPYERKEATRSKAIWNAVIPSECVVPLQQHIGGRAEAVVAEGDEVREGMLIGKASGFVSANVHSPIPGTVSELREVALPNGVRTTAVVIALEGEFDRLGKTPEPRDYSSLSPKQLLSAIQEAGIVGMGGATFPTHVKYTLPKGATADYLILNGTECEPYLSSDHRLMLEVSDGVLHGLAIVRKVLSAERVAVGIEENKPDAIKKMRGRIKAMGLPFAVVPLRIKYPQGDEKQLIKAITGREVPSGGLPIDIGTVVSNAGTLNAIYEAVAFGKPLIERIVTVTGGAIKNPGNLKARIGTPFGELIEECGGFSRMPEKIIAGGPMMGLAVYDLDTPVTKGTSGILALTPEEVNKGTQTACIQCGRCVRACPIGLEPTTLYKLIDHESYAEALSEGLMDCRECGCCGYICPAHIPLVQGLKVGKMMARRKKIKVPA